ncbi:MAG: 30S ribosomal protein S12 methylthiotransferase RimO [Lachnospiraceae bacterium]|nr:30S ribosomal protein S12 methylthiotransferase RimO [Lachnospiraceae bacterium]MDD7025852.1 30S ribosomal protein S12 methylthiotransferase RimO [Lachnospiraceae bacterium]MDY5701374.1 30S ribosomal protein S12 methylthiotransferase RimO [Lachnospiraceae bacterium]
MNILFVSLGCDKNLVDTEMMLGMLGREGFAFTDDEEQADIVVVNTCCFIHDAKEESINTILEMAELKKTGRAKALLVTGCLAQRYQEEIRTEIPEVDCILGTTAIDQIVQAVKEVLEGKNAGMGHMEDIDRTPVYGQKRVVTTGGHYAYLKIAEGCDKNCTYCIIPKVRGKFRSVPMEVLLKEAEELVSQGVKELILVAQETTLYGVDLYGEKRLPQLLDELNRIPGLYWIRLLYCYPEEITNELIKAIKRNDKVCHYLDIPIQHGCDSVLKRMGRRTTSGKLRETVANLRQAIPDICLRTSLITGFPGETEEDHEILMDFVDDMEFDRLGVFTYSLEEDTPAALMEEQIDEEVKIQRRQQLMALQQEIAFEKAQTMEGSRLLVMIEGRLEEEDVYIGRSYRDAPNVDGYVFVHTDKNLMTGDFVWVSITGSHEYDLIGEVEQNEFTE